MRIGVTGASGFVGSALCTHLRASGHIVVRIVRAQGAETERAETERHGPRVIASWSKAELGAALRDVEAVVHAAAIVHKPHLPASDYQDFNVRGTQDLVAAAEANQVQRLVFISSIKVYGEAPEAVMDEALAPAPLLAYAKTKLEAEGIASAGSFPQGTLVLRLAPVYGVGDKGNVRTMIERIAKRQLLIPGSGQTKKSLVHVGLVARSIEAACRSEKSGVYVCSNQKTPTIGELADEIAKVLGRRPPPRIPQTVLGPIAKGVDALTKRLRLPLPRATDLVRKSQIESICDSEKLRRELKVDTHCDLAATLREEAEWLKRIGRIK
jgi:GlcNAc-P-P-Und epimerase